MADKGKKEERPDLGSGMAEKGAKDVERRHAKTERRIAQIFGAADKGKDKPQGKADK